MPGLGESNGTKGGQPKWKLEYTTYELSALHGPGALGEDALGGGGTSDEYRVPVKELPRVLREWNGTGEVSGKYTPYGLKDLTVGSWVSLARRLGNTKKGKLRRRFSRYMYMEVE